MLSDLKVFNFYMKRWILVFSFIQFVLLAFMIGSLTTPKWVETDFDVMIGYSKNFYDDWSTFRSSKFEGGIATCYKGYKLGGDEDKVAYGELERDICDIEDDIDDDFIDSNEYEIDSTDNVKSICKMFQGLSAGAVIKVVFDIACMIALLFWFVGMMCMLGRVNCFCMTYVCSVCTFCLFYIGSILWFVVTGATFGSCSEKPHNGDHPKICATHGPGLMIFVMIIILPIIILYIVIACKAQKKRLKKSESSSQNNQNIPPSAQMQNFQTLQSVNNNPGAYPSGSYPPIPYLPINPQGGNPSGAYPPVFNAQGVYAHDDYAQNNLYNPSYHQANFPNHNQYNVPPPPAVIAKIPNDAEVN